MQFCQVNERINGLQSDTSDTLIVPLLEEVESPDLQEKLPFHSPGMNERTSHFAF